MFFRQAFKNEFNAELWGSVRSTLNHANDADNADDANATETTIEGLDERQLKPLVGFAEPWRVGWLIKRGGKRRPNWKRRMFALLPKWKVPYDE